MYRHPIYDNGIVWGMNHQAKSAKMMASNCSISLQFFDAEWITKRE